MSDPIPESEIRFGRLVVEQGLATAEQVEDGLRALRALAAVDFSPLPHLREILVRKGFLSPWDMERWTRLLEPPHTPMDAAPREGPAALTRSQERDLPPEAAAGERFDKYLKTRKLGEGGMGTVWKAWDTELRRWVALKFLKIRDAEETARFRREAQTSAKLQHPHIAALYEARDDFISMQYIEGTTLETFSRADPRILAEALRQAALGVQYAHEQGILHRDIKPANIMAIGGRRAPATPRVAGVAQAPKVQVFVMDFGLAKTMHVNSSLSASGLVVGTPNYMSPEQAKGATKGLDPRSDVYSLGATLYYLLTGRPPFESANVYEVLTQAASVEPRPVRKLAPAADRDLETISMKCLEKNPARRYQTARELADDLERWLTGEPIMAHPPSILYRVRKRILKDMKFSAAVAAAILLLLAGAVVVPAVMRARRAAERRAEAIAHIEEARRRHEAGDFPGALEHARRAQQLDPQLPGGWYWEAREAIREYAEQQRLPTPWVSDGLIEFLPAPEEPPAAVALRERAIGLVEKMRSSARDGLEGWEEPGALGMVSILRGRYEEGERRLSACLANPRARWDTEAKYYQALARYFRRRFADAAAADLKILGTAAGTDLLVRACQGAAMEDLLHGRSARALDRYAQAKAFAANDPDKARGRLLEASMLISRGDLYARIGRSADARADYELAREASGEMTEAPSEALARDAFHERGEALLALGRLLERQGKGAEAIERVRGAVADFTESVRREENFLPAIMRRGMAHLWFALEARGLFEVEKLQDEKEAAIRDFERVLRAGPQPQAILALHHARVSVYSTPLSHSRLEDLDDLIGRFPEYLPTYLRRSEIMAGLAQNAWEKLREDPTPYFEKAVRDATLALESDDQYAEAYHKRAWVHAGWGDYLMIHGKDPAEEYALCFADCERALKINPELYETYSLRAAKRHSMAIYKANQGGDPEADWLPALEDLAQLGRLNPESPDSYQTRAIIRFNLGVRYEQSGREPFDQYALGVKDCEEAEARMAWAQPGGHPDYRRGFIQIEWGRALARRGKLEEARSRLEAGIKELTQSIGETGSPGGDSSTTVSEIILYRGIGLCALGRHEEAQKDFAEALRRGFGPAQPLLEACRKHTQP